MSDLLFTCLEFAQLSNSELYELLKLRSEVFVVEQDCVYLDQDGYDQRSLHLLGKVDGRLVAYARLLPETVKYADAVSIGRVVTAGAARRYGYGRRLMAEAIACCQRTWPHQPIIISAQQYLEKFYQEFGFSTVSGPYLEDGIPHLRMRREPSAGRAQSERRQV